MQEPAGSNIDLSVPDGAKDALYASYIMTLVKLDSSAGRSQPDFKRIQLLRAKAEADVAELEVMAMRLSLIRKSDAERMHADLVSAAGKEVEQTFDVAKDALQDSRDAHPRLAKRNMHVRTTVAAKQASDRLQEMGVQRLKESRERSARAAKIRHLLQPDTIEFYKQEFARQLGAEKSFGRDLD